MNSETENGWCPFKNPTAPLQKFTTARRLVLRRIAVALWALVALVLIPLASAQRLDNVWFKLRFTGKGYTMDNAGRCQKLTVSAPVYIHFISTGAHEYSAQIWTKTQSGWSNSTSSDIETVGVNENIISDWGGTLYGDEGSSVHVYCTFYVSVKTDKNGAVGEILETAVHPIGSSGVAHSRHDEKLMPLPHLNAGERAAMSLSAAKASRL